MKHVTAVPKIAVTNVSRLDIIVGTHQAETEGVEPETALNCRKKSAAEDLFKIPAGQSTVNGKRKNICSQQLAYTTYPRGVSESRVFEVLKIPGILLVLGVLKVLGVLRVLGVLKVLGF